MGSLWAPRISHHLMDRAMKQSTHQFHKMFVHISKCLACNAVKTVQLKPPNITRSNIEHCNHWKKTRTIILSYLSGVFPDKVNLWCCSYKNALVTDGDIKVMANKF